jgi:hypothetical protein
MGICPRFKENAEEHLFSRIKSSILATNPMGETMKMPRLTMLTLGVADLQAATHFYEPD